MNLRAPLQGTGTRRGSPPGRSSSRRRRRARRRTALAVVVVLVAAYAAVTVAFFVEPTPGVVPHPAAVVVLHGYGNRDSRGLAVARAHHVRTVAVSQPPYATCPKPASGLRIWCFAPRPVSTQGEARAVARLARVHHWNRLLVVAGTTQVERARLRIERCYPGPVAFSAVDPTGFFGWVYQVVYDQAAIVKALVWQRGC